MEFLKSLHDYNPTKDYWDKLIFHKDASKVTKPKVYEIYMGNRKLKKKDNKGDKNHGLTNRQSKI